MSKKNTKIALAALCVLGAACYLLQFVLGEDITHMNNFVPWGLYIVGLDRKSTRLNSSHP